MKRRLKYLTVPLLILLVASSFSTAFVQIAFNVNKAQIIKELCQNRFRPEKKCNGKCYLKKQLKEDTESKKDKDAKLVNEALNWLSVHIVDYHFYLAGGSTLVCSIFFNLPSGHTAPIDHPPSRFV